MAQFHYTIYNGMEIVSNTYGKGIYVLDRGFYGAILMHKTIEIGCDFIVRTRNPKRNIYINGNKKLYQKQLKS